MEFLEEIASGDERRALVAMRDLLAEHMTKAEPNVVAQVAARLQTVVQRLSDLGPVEKVGSTSDDLAAKRAGRRSAAPVVEAPARPSVKRGRRSG